MAASHYKISPTALLVAYMRKKYTDDAKKTLRLVEPYIINLA